MARGSTRKTERVAVADPQLRPPRIEDHTRYINSRASRNGVAEAQALRDAFTVGQDIAEDKLREQYQEGVDRAITQRALGEGRDDTDENIGYNKAWDQLDAEYDLNRVKEELPSFSVVWTQRTSPRLKSRRRSTPTSRTTSEASTS